MDTLSLHPGDALETMASLPDASINMILADIPYGITRNPWDTIIPMAPMWEQFRRLCTGAIVLHAVQPFTSQLVSSNLRDFRYSLVWVKEQGTGQLNARHRPMRKHEDILVFWRERPPYNPQMSFGHRPYKVTRKAGSRTSVNYGAQLDQDSTSASDGSRHPTSVLEFGRERGLHPTQKPVQLLENLIRTYTDRGATVLDCCMGSGSTGVAAVNTGRRFIGIERDPEYFALAKQRIEAAQAA